MLSRSNWNLKVLVFKERGKQEYPEKNLSEQGREPTTNSTHIWRRRQDSNPGHIGGRRALSPLRHPCSLMSYLIIIIIVIIIIIIIVIIIIIIVIIIIIITIILIIIITFI